jgi:hypothetical protein
MTLWVHITYLSKSCTGRNRARPFFPCGGVPSAIKKDLFCARDCWKRRGAVLLKKSGQRYPRPWISCLSRWSDVSIWNVGIQQNWKCRTVVVFIVWWAFHSSFRLEALLAINVWLIATSRQSRRGAIES